jgi:hypothetical protein
MTPDASGSLAASSIAATATDAPSGLFAASHFDTEDIVCCRESPQELAAGTDQLESSQSPRKIGDQRTPDTVGPTCGHGCPNP